MPPDDSNEFEMHLEQSVHNLQTLRNDLSTDVFISYCVDDVPCTPAEQERKVHPRQVMDALVQDGYTWSVLNVALVRIEVHWHLVSKRFFCAKYRVPICREISAKIRN